MAICVYNVTDWELYNPAGPSYTWSVLSTKGYPGGGGMYIDSQGAADAAAADIKTQIDSFIIGSTITGWTCDSVSLTYVDDTHIIINCQISVDEDLVGDWGVPSSMVDLSYPAIGSTEFFNSNCGAANRPVICDTCERLTLPACDVLYSIVAGLEGNTEYFVSMEDMFNRMYTQSVTTDANGDFSIDASATEFPAGFFTPEAGGLTIKVFLDEELTDQQDIVNNGTQYTCIQLAFQYVVTTTSSYMPDFERIIDDYSRHIDDDTYSNIAVG